MFDFIKYLFGCSRLNKIEDDLDMYDYELIDEEEDNMPKKIIVDFSILKDIVSIQYQNNYIVITYLVKYTDDTVAFENHNVYIEHNSQYEDVIEQYQEYMKIKNVTDTIDKTS